MLMSCGKLLSQVFTIKERAKCAARPDNCWGHSGQNVADSITYFKHPIGELPVPGSVSGLLGGATKRTRYKR